MEIKAGYYCLNIAGFFFTDKQYLIIQLRDFPGGPVAKTPYFHTPNVGDLGPNPGQGTRSHMLQIRPSTAK